MTFSPVPARSSVSRSINWGILGTGVIARRFADDFVHLTYRPCARHAGLSHKGDIELCLRAGKAVLCEKPLTVNMREAEEVIALARRNRVFLMEAMWTRFLPLVVRLRKLLAQRVVGEIRHVMADLSSQVTFDPGSRVYSG